MSAMSLLVQPVIATPCSAYRRVFQSPGSFGAAGVRQAVLPKCRSAGGTIQGIPVCEKVMVEMRHGDREIAVEGARWRLNGISEIGRRTWRLP
jgi:hypothetical protein